MKKEYTKMTRQAFDADMKPLEDMEEDIMTSLIADEGMTFKDLTTGFVGGVRIDLGPDDSEENYIEVVNTYGLTPEQVAEMEQRTVDKIEAAVSGEIPADPPKEVTEV